MKLLILLFSFLIAGESIFAQSTGPTTLLLKGDSVKVTNCDSAELIIENHTQAVPGFLFNTGNGRTIFKRGVIKINDSTFLIGGDTMKLHAPSTAYWALAGNSAVNPSRQFIGTVDTSTLTFRTSNAERLRLFPNGNIGINTGSTDNGFRLQVNGNVNASGTKHLIGNLEVTSGSYAGDYSTCGIRLDGPDYVPFIFTGTVHGGNDMFIFNDVGGGSGMGVTSRDQSIIRIKSGFSSSNGANNNATVLNLNPTYNLPSTSNPPLIRGIYYNPLVGPLVSGTRHIAIETTTGDVVLGTTSGNTGIGTNSPTAQLHTTGTVRFAGLTADSTQTRVLVSDANGNIYYRSASSIASNGILNSGLADNPTINSSLAVNGEIRAQRLRLSQTGWPDYVFAGGYHLPSLSELEQYIQRNSHLPDMPSAEEVEKKGIDVGDHQAALLKKIEELTLIAIAQEKKLQSQDDKLSALKPMEEKLQMQDKEIAGLKAHNAAADDLIKELFKEMKEMSQIKTK